jgi:hypothetical protein
MGSVEGLACSKSRSPSCCTAPAARVQIRTRATRAARVPGRRRGGGARSACTPTARARTAPGPNQRHRELIVSPLPEGWLGRVDDRGLGRARRSRVAATSGGRGRAGPAQRGRRGRRATSGGQPQPIVDSAGRSDSTAVIQSSRSATASLSTGFAPTRWHPHHCHDVADWHSLSRERPDQGSWT